MTLQDLMMLYGVTLGKRKTKKQRYLFAKQLKEAAEEMGLEYNVVGHKTQRWNVENIIIGSPKKANYIIAVGYDTPSQSLLFNDYYPFHIEKTIQTEKNDIFVHLAISILFLGFGFLSFKLAKGRIIFYVIAVIAAAFGIYNLFGQANQFNFNRNSAAVAVAMKLLEDVEKEKLCVIFCDKYTKGYDGYRLMRQEVFNRHKVIILDGIAYGTNLVIAHSKEQKEFAEAISTELEAMDKCYSDEKAKNNILAVVPQCVFITSGEVENGEFVIKNTRSKNDVKLDKNRLQKIETVLCEYMNQN